MDIKKILDYLWLHYDVTRHSGHTTALMEGANNTKNPVIIGVDHHHSRFLKNTCQNKNVDVIPLSVISEQLRGRKSPILFDNYALYTIFKEASKEILRLQFLLDHQDFWNSDREFIQKVSEIVEREGRKKAEDKLEKIKKIIND